MKDRERFLAWLAIWAAARTARYADETMLWRDARVVARDSWRSWRNTRRGTKASLKLWDELDRLNPPEPGYTRRHVR